MSFSNIQGFLCYNNEDLIRDGYIHSSLERIYDNPDDDIIRKTENPQRGVSYVLERNKDGDIVKITEKRKQLPAEQIKIEIEFSKITNTMGNSRPDLDGIGQLGAGSGYGAMIAASPIPFLAISEPGITEMTFHICDAETKINTTLIINDNIRSTGIIELNNYPLSVFGIVKDTPLNFSESDLENLGRFASSTFRGRRSQNIKGATDSKGQFGEIATPAVDINDILENNQENLFIEIIQDERLLKFRADNKTIIERKGYPFNYVTPRIDITSHKIRINTENLNVGDTIYLTYSEASDRHVRQNIRHTGVVAQIGFGMGALSSRTDAFDYQIKDWYATKSFLIDDDSSFKVSYQNYKKFTQGQTNDDYEIIEGWRLSESITDRIETFFTADYRGILLYNEGKTHVIIPSNKIPQFWFLDYLNSLGPEFKITKNGETVFRKFEDVVHVENLSGFLFNLSQLNNTLFFDREKIPYYRPLALAINKINNLNLADIFGSLEKTGVIGLDILYNYVIDNNGVFFNWESAFEEAISFINNFFEDDDLQLFDLSNATFEYSKSRPQKYSSCSGDITILPENYFSTTYDPVNGPGIFASIATEWDLRGFNFTASSLESFWYVSMPYFCGSFSRKTRIYMENIGGNTINTYSWIYADTAPSITSTISVDNNILTDKSFIVFNEDNINKSLSFHELDDGFFEDIFKFTNLDFNQNYEEEEFNHDKHKIIGFNRILGDKGSYNFGRQVIPVDRTTEIKSILPINFLNAQYGLDFNDPTPNITIPENWMVKDIIIKYRMKDNGIKKIRENVEKNKYSSLKFNSTNSVINNIEIPYDLKRGESNKYFIRCKYYKGSPILLLGEFWKNIIVESMAGFVVESDSFDSNKVFVDQSAIVFDRNGRAIIFYADQISNNISVVISYNGGETWSKYPDIIRIIKGETVSFPFAISDNNGFIVHLFFILNDSFIMYKKFNTELFNYNDIDKIYTPPDSYDQTSDDDNEDNENSSIFNYTTDGKTLRREPSYFIFGNTTDNLFIEQIKTNILIREKNNNIDDIKNYQHIRYDFKGDILDMGIFPYDGDAFSVYIDDKGIKRLFIIVKNRLYIKSSGDFLRWEFDLVDSPLHEDFIGDINKGKDIEIKNIQIVRNYHNRDIISVLYFHDGMLFMRNFLSNLLFKNIDQEGNLSNDDITRQIIEMQKNNNQPLFLVGNISDDIKRVLVDDPSLAIKIPYSQEIADKFNEGFTLDTDTQPFGYIDRGGSIRIFYKDNSGILRGLIIEGFKFPSPDISYSLKEDVE